MRMLFQNLRRHAHGHLYSGIFPAWLLSFAIHLALLLSVSLLTYTLPMRFELTLFSEDVEVIEPEEFHFANEVIPEIGSQSLDGLESAMQTAPDAADVPEIIQPKIEALKTAEIDFSQELQVETAPFDDSVELNRGLAGVATNGAPGAIDRITEEILESLDKQDTLVVWLFDQSGSLVRQRKEIRARLDRIYEELGLIREDVKRLSATRQPLLTAMMAFGKTHSWLIKKPTADVAEIKQAVGNIRLDETGDENVFAAIYAAAENFKRIRSRRNIMLIAVTDEVGDDANRMLERTINVCQRYAMPVYVLGVPAAFGEPETVIKWVDPDPKYDQTARRGRVNQGPESLFPERIQLPFAGAPRESIDSGFGPFALTRLCVQTGGIYFTIHPNRNTQRRVGWRETDAFSSHIAYFFDPQRMHPYRPDYVSAKEYQRQITTHPARQAVVRASVMTISRLNNPQTYFVKRDDAQFAATLTEAQKAAATLEPKIRALYEILKQGEEQRETEDSLRWQAAFDLAYGQVLAVLVRARTYNEMLAQAKRGLKPDDKKSNTWRLVPDDAITVNTRLDRESEKAKEYLGRVAKDHAGTPWALLASRELDMHMGWKWQESYTPLENNQRRGNNNNADNEQAAPQDDQKRVIPRRPLTRDVPRL